MAERMTGKRIAEVLASAAVRGDESAIARIERVAERTSSGSQSPSAARNLARALRNAEAARAGGSGRDPGPGPGPGPGPVAPPLPWWMMQGPGTPLPPATPGSGPAAPISTPVAIGLGLLAFLALRGR